MPEPGGIIVIWTSLQGEEPNKKKHTEHIYWCCKGECDRVLKGKYYQTGLVDGWEDIPDLMNPLAYIRWVMVMLNQLQSGITYSTQAHADCKIFLLNLFPLVSRDMTNAERDHIKSLEILPHYLGGWGYEN